MPPALRSSIASGMLPMLPSKLARYAKRSFLAMDRTPEAMFFDNFASIRLADQRQLLSTVCRGGSTSDTAYGASLGYFNAPNAQARCSTACSTPTSDLSRRALMKQDQMSCRWSAAPFLDLKRSSCPALPDQWKLRHKTKRVLRDR
jgi:hypothetical protein